MLTRDRDWAFLDGLLCEANNFTPLAKLENGQVVSIEPLLPYASISIRCRESNITLSPNAKAAICHKSDFKNLWHVFIDRGVSDNEKVFIVWSKRNLQPIARIFSAFMPRLAVLVFKGDGYELLADKAYRPDLRGIDRMDASMPIVNLQPTGWR